MRRRRYAGVVVLIVILGWQGAAGAATMVARDQQQAVKKPPTSSICMARCVEMEVKCEAYERESPSCGTADVCLEEREQCDTLCRVTARLGQDAYQWSSC